MKKILMVLLLSISTSSYANECSDLFLKLAVPIGSQAWKNNVQRANVNFAKARAYLKSSSRYDLETANASIEFAIKTLHKLLLEAGVLTKEVRAGLTKDEAHNITYALRLMSDLQFLSKKYGESHEYSQIGANYEKAYSVGYFFHQVRVQTSSLTLGQQKISEIGRAVKILDERITNKINGDISFYDSGFSWSALGDIRMLLGDIQGAASAYKSFVERAQTSSPKLHIEQLKTLRAELEFQNDPSVEYVQGAIDALASLIGQ